MSAASTTTPLFGLADCDSFYASCEAVFRSDWRGKPLVVLGNNDGNIIARSRQAKALGVPMGAALHQVRDRIRQYDIIVCSANFALYGDMSQRVMAVLDQFTPQLDVYSIDEAFLDLSPVATLPLAQRHAFVARMRQRVGRWTGIPLSVGVASTKTLAKAAAETAKHDLALGGVCMLGDECEAPGTREALLRALPVGDVWGIGPRRAKLLAGYGIVTALDLAEADAHWVRQHLTVTGARTQLELRGISCLPLDEPPVRRQQLCTSRSFGRPVREMSELREAAALFTAHVAARCRTQRTIARRLTIFVTTNPFRDAEPQYNASATLPLARATADTLELLEAASVALARVWRPGFNYHKLGVILSEFADDELRQGELFSDAELASSAVHRERARSEALMQMLDAINARFGHDMIRPLSAGIVQPWRMKQAHRSPRYTTHWGELAEVR